jgi:hypothetical protein
MHHARAVCLATVLVGKVLLGSSLSGADEPPGNGATVIGGVQEFIRDPAAKIVGATLDDGTIVHWPSVAGPAIARIVRIGD